MSTEWTNPMEWNAEGSEPSETLKENGFQAGYKPPADVFNFFFNKTGKCITELQAKSDEHQEALENQSGETIPIDRGGTGATTKSDALKNLAGASGTPFGLPLTYSRLSSTELVSESATTETVALAMATHKAIAFVHSSEEAIHLTDAPHKYGYCILFKGYNNNYIGGFFFAINGKLYKYKYHAASPTGNGWHQVYTDLDTIPLSNVDVAEATAAKSGLLSAVGAQVLALIAKGQTSHSLSLLCPHDFHSRGDYSLAIGMNTAKGDNSVAVGYNTVANNYQFTAGRLCTDSAGATDNNDTTGDIFKVGVGTDTGGNANALRITTAGKCYGQSSFGGSGADFAELFEYADGNADNEDRRGLMVALEGEKIRLAKAGDNILGIISANASYIGDTASEEWHDKYLRDIFGEKILEIVEVPETVDEEGKIIPAHISKRWKLNPDYNPDEKYIPREERAEWGTVGLLGKVVAVDDGSCKVGEYCTASENGIVTYSIEKTKFYCMKRIDEKHIQVLVGA